MPKRMLVDASHTEETRVVVLDGSKVEEFDFEAASRRPLKGNIYLAKVTRVEPSLQAAFVEYGGNRQGFLAFSEIHPDYYQIPVADRMALLADQSRRLMAEDDFESVRTARPQGPAAKAAEHAIEDNPPPEPTGAVEEEPHVVEASEDEPPGEVVYTNHPETAGEDDAVNTGEEQRDQGSETIERDVQTEPVESAHEELSEPSGQGREEDERAVDGRASHDEDDAHDEEDGAPDEGAHDEEQGEGEPGSREDALAVAEGEAYAEAEARAHEPVRAEATGVPTPYERREHRPRPPRRRQYKIQEVIKRRQVMLVQVVKEERGTKGASLTTYLSLAGRYCVLMPNTPRGGGISRKITSATDRRRLKSAAQSLELPEGMGLIIRTAGANRTKVEIKRDYEYLLRLWDSVRELTLKSNAPALVYEEGNLIKRAIRDLYNKDISEILVDGESGYRDAKDFMRMLMPSHAKNVKPYKEPLPLFQRHGVESQLDAMFSPTVTLRSGGYIVINQAEALVAIDVNSGKATREHSIEETAYKTNMEAADEIGRQLRLRDLAGLIVIDFIDMEDGKNDRAVEKRLRDAVRNDRARVQIGKISQFGLLEMSRQRLRAGVVAGSTVTCPHCAGVGFVRSTESAALKLLRALDEEGQRQSGANIIVKAPEDIVIFTLNQKRREVARIEDAYELSVQFSPQLGMAGGSFEIERTGVRAVIAHAKPQPAASLMASYVKEEEEEAKDVTIVEAPPAAPRESEASTERTGHERKQGDRRPHSHGHRHQDRHQQDRNQQDRPQQGHQQDRHRGGDFQSQNERHGEGGEGRRRRRRRRRGGRGRHGEMENHVPTEGQMQRPAETQRPTEMQQQERTEGSAPFRSGEEPHAARPPMQSEARPQGEGRGEEGGRRRRRRRGRRGRHRDGEGGQDSSRQGISDRPSADAPRPEVPGETAAEREVEIPVAGFGIAPNTPSSPQWSFDASEAARESHSSAREVERREPTPPSMRSEPEVSVPEPAPEPTEPGPRRGGWWQRRFKS